MSKKIFYLIVVIFLSANFVNAQRETIISTQTDKQKVPVVIPSNDLENKISLVEGKVIVIYDGDSLSVKTPDNKIYSIRLQGIDAPEGKQEYGGNARKTLKDFVLDKDVRIVIHKKDLYDRYLGTVYYEGKDINLLMIENGMAWHYKQYSNEQTSEERKKYSQAEEKARSERIGLWKAEKPLPPWDFGRGGKSAEKNSQENDSERKNSDGKQYILGPRGGCYYVSASGRKVYVKDKSLCGN